MGFLGQYVESQWGLANFTVPAECACVCAFGPGKSVIGTASHPKQKTNMGKVLFSQVSVCLQGRGKGVYTISIP